MTSMELSANPTHYKAWHDPSMQLISISSDTNGSSDVGNDGGGSSTGS